MPVTVAGLGRVTLRFSVPPVGKANEAGAPGAEGCGSSHPPPCMTPRPGEPAAPRAPVVAGVTGTFLRARMPPVVELVRTATVSFVEGRTIPPTTKASHRAGFPPAMRMAAVSVTGVVAHFWKASTSEATVRTPSLAKPGRPKQAVACVDSTSDAATSGVWMIGFRQSRRATTHDRVLSRTNRNGTPPSAAEQSPSGATGELLPTQRAESAGGVVGQPARPACRFILPRRGRSGWGSRSAGRGSSVIHPCRRSC